MRAGYYALACLVLLLSGTAEAARRGGSAHYAQRHYAPQSPYSGYADYMAQRNRYYPPASAYSNRAAPAYRAAPRAYSAPPGRYPAAPQSVYRTAPQPLYRSAPRRVYRSAPQPVYRSAPKAAYPAAPQPQNTTIYRYHGPAKQPAYSPSRGARAGQPLYRYPAAPQPLYRYPAAPRRVYRPPAPPRRYATPYNGGGYHCRYFPYPNAGGTYSAAANTVYNESWSRNHPRAARPNRALNPICGGFSSNIVTRPSPAPAPLLPQAGRLLRRKASAAPRKVPLNQHLYP